PGNHEKAPTSPDFAENLLEALFAEGGIPLAKRKGLLRKLTVCPRCEHELPQQAQPSLFKAALKLRQPGAEYEVEFEHVGAERPSSGDPSVFSVELKCPALSCGKCGIRMAAPSTAVQEALADAMDAALPAGR
ncbi:MAG: hypothetical protein ACRES4_05035, partial [Nevskiales bacterium]